MRLLQRGRRGEKRKRGDLRPVERYGEPAAGKEDAFPAKQDGLPSGEGRQRAAEPHGTGVKRAGVIQQGDQLPLIQQVGRGAEHRMDGGRLGLLRQQVKKLCGNGFSGRS